MKKSTQLIIILFVLLDVAFAQIDTALRMYSIHSKLEEACTAEIAVTLFDEATKMDRVNQMILDELLQGYYDTKTSSITLKNLYANKVMPPSSEFWFTIAGTCSYHKYGIFSFIACPYNVCDKAPRSNFEANTITVDMETGKKLSLMDIIDPLKKDSFENYIYFMATRYHIKNIPTCYISGYHPAQIKGSNNIMIQTDTITYLKGLTGKFYIKDDYIFVYNNAKHRDYNFNSVEVLFPVLKLGYFLRQNMLHRFGFK